MADLIVSPCAAHTITRLGELNTLKEDDAFINAFRENCAFIYNSSDEQIKTVLEKKKLNFLKQLIDDLMNEALIVAEDQVIPENGRKINKKTAIDRINVLGRIIATATESKSNEENDNHPELNPAAEAFVSGDTRRAEALLNGTAALIDLTGTEPQPKIEEQLAQIRIELATGRKKQAISEDLIDKMQKQIKTLEDFILNPTLRMEDRCSACLRTSTAPHTAPNVPHPVLPKTTPNIRDQVTSVILTDTAPVLPPPPAPAKDTEAQVPPHTDAISPTTPSIGAQAPPLTTTEKTPTAAATAAPAPAPTIHNVT